MQNSERKFILYLLIGILALSNVVLIVFSFNLVKEQRRANSTELPLIDRVGDQIIIDQTEEPTIATIEDINTLKAVKPEIYKNAENGDKILVFSDRVIIYREKDDLIVNVIPLSRYKE